MPTQGEINARIRGQLNEATARFFSDALIMGWYSDYAANQHRIAVEGARQANMLQNVAHPYLKQFSKMAAINVIDQQAFYALPSDFLAVMHVGLVDVSNVSEKDCIELTGEDDWFTENLPHLQPTYERPSFSFRIDPSTGLSAIRLYAFGNQGVPNAPGVLRVYYVRDLTRITSYVSTLSVDLADPYNEGPIWGAVGEATLKRGGDPGGFFALAEHLAQNIFAPMAASSATAAQAQGKGSASAIEGSERRDAR